VLAVLATAFAARGMAADAVSPEEAATLSAQPDSGQAARAKASITKGDLVALPHRPNYVLPYSYVHEPNVAPFLLADPETDWKHDEIKFQISLKVPFANDLLGARGDRFGNNLDLWFGYTQVSFWQAYHFERSSPFRETNYEPEIGFTYRGHGGADRQEGVLYQRGQFILPSISAGFAHQSNGEGGTLSRSWNRIWLSFVLGYGEAWTFWIKPWVRVPESASSDNNPDLQDYAGRAEFLAIYRIGGHQISAMLRNNLQAQDNRSGYEVDWTFPVSDWKFKLLVQFYNGYGESLIDYDVRTRRIGIGALVNDW